MPTKQHLEETPRWQIYVAFITMIMVVIVLTGIVIASSGEPFAPPTPTVVPPITFESHDASDGITCIQIVQGQKTLGWECFSSTPR